MDRQEIAALFARRQEVWNRLDAGVLIADYTTDGRVESPLAGGTALGHTAIETLSFGRTSRRSAICTWSTTTC